MSKKNTATVFIISFLLSVVFINLISSQEFFRFDLTAEKNYTLSAASAKTMNNLEDVMVVNAYFSEDIPMPYSGYAQYVRDLLAEYRAVSHGRLSFEFIDPLEEETREDKTMKREARRDIFGRLMREPTTIEVELASMGIDPVEIQMIDDDQKQTKRAYMGIVIRYQGKQEAIPVVQEVANLEKEMTLLMRRLVRKEIPIIAVASDVPTASINQWKMLAEKNVEIKDVSNIDEIEQWEKADALVYLGVAKKLLPSTVKRIDEFMRSGKGVALLFDRYLVNMQTFQTQPLGTESADLVKLLGSYGVSIGLDLVADINCATLNVTEERGGMLMNVPVRYPFIPDIPMLNQKSTLAQGLTGVMLPFISSLQVMPTEGIQVTAVASSSKNSWVETGTIDTNPSRNWKNSEIDPSGPYVLMSQINNDQNQWRFLVAGTSKFLWDTFLGGPNLNLALNLLDWISAEEDLLAMRSRALIDIPLDLETSDETKSLMKYGNIIGMPCLLIIYGLLRRNVRNRRRKKLSILK